MKLEEIVITNHAKLRCGEINVPIEKIPFLLLQAKYQKENIFRSFYKFLNYGKKQEGVSYYYRKGSTRYPPLLFTVLEKDNKAIVLTVTKKKLK